MGMEYSLMAATLEHLLYDEKMRTDSFHLTFMC